MVVFQVAEAVVAELVPILEMAEKVVMVVEVRLGFIHGKNKLLWVL
jgi:hypothetical protein